MRATVRSTSGSVALALALLLAACGGSDAAAEFESPASKEPIPGTDLYTVYLTEAAAERLDVNTAEVVADDQGLAVPSAAIVIDPEGRFWVYMADESLAYHRVEISDAREENGWTYFSEGPEPGTQVVVEGVPELYGEETGVGK